MRSLNDNLKETARIISTASGKFTNMSFKRFLKLGLCIMCVCFFGWIILMRYSNIEKGDCYYAFPRDIPEIEAKGLLKNAEEIELLKSQTGKPAIESSSGFLNMKRYYLKLKEGEKVSIPAYKTWFISYGMCKFTTIDNDNPQILTLLKRPNVLYGNRRKLYIIVVPDAPVIIKQEKNKNNKTDES